MFNPLTVDQLVAALGTMLHDAGRGDGSLSSFEREQMLSAYSLSRHLRGEIRGAAAFAAFAGRTEGLLADAAAHRAAAGDAEWASALREAAETVSAGDVARTGEAVADLLQALRAARPDWAPPLVHELHRALAGLADAEVAVLAEALA
jgi:hypothetical protein